MINFAWRYIKKIPRIPRRISKAFFRLIFELLGPRPLLLGSQIDEEAKIQTIEDIKREVQREVPTERDLKMVEIIVLKYKDPEVETRCVQKIIENTEWPYKLTVYDNRWGTKNMSKIWNKLIKESICDYILIMDSDVFVPRLKPCWLTRMMEVFYDPNCFVVVPKVSKTSNPEQKGSAERTSVRKLKTIFAAQCVLYKKEIFDKVGYFDEEFLFYGQDSEWASRLMKEGFDVYLRPDVSVEHLKHYSISKASKNKEFNAQAEREYAEQLLREKTK